MMINVVLLTSAEPIMTPAAFAQAYLTSMALTTTACKSRCDGTPMPCLVVSPYVSTPETLNAKIAMR